MNPSQARIEAVELVRRAAQERNPYKKFRLLTQATRLFKQGRRRIKREQ